LTYSSNAAPGAEAKTAVAVVPLNRGTNALAAVPPDLWQALARHGLLLPLLRQSVIAAAVADVAIGEQESLECRQAWGAAHRLGSTEAVIQHLKAHGLQDTDALWQAELPLRIARHCEEHFSHRAEQRFLARKNQLDQVIYSLLRVEDAALARELYLRIAEGEADFAELAARYSQGPERSTRGVVGPVPCCRPTRPWQNCCAPAGPASCRLRFELNNGGWWFGWNRYAQRALITKCAIAWPANCSMSGSKRRCGSCWPSTPRHDRLSPGIARIDRSDRSLPDPLHPGPTSAGAGQQPGRVQ
jgi:hypothetical protein